MDEKTLRLQETLFHNANGYIGVRGTWEEGVPSGYDTMRGTYLNGFYDVIPCKQSESLYGLIEEKDTMLNVADTQTVCITVDNEVYDPFCGEVLHCERTLDMEAGITERTMRWRSEQGRVLTVTFRRMASFQRKNLFVMECDIRPEDGGRVEVTSYHKGLVKNYANPKDPRLAADSGILLQAAGHSRIGEDTYLLSHTAKSDLAVCTAVRHAFPGSADISYDAQSHSYIAQYATTLRKGENLRFVKYTIAVDSRHAEDPIAAAKKLVANDCVALAGLYAEQWRYLENFWHNAEMEIDADDESNLAMAFNQYQLLQSCGSDGLSYVASKGLSGEGYEGHYFWDTEIYVLPFLTYTNPALARKLLRYRYKILPLARENAKILGHSKGALYPWRTISGRECSGFFPAGTAQYHINGDIACAVVRYYLATLDQDYLIEEGAEILLETARLWLDVGNWNDGCFMIHGVTGPDEYSCIVNNNYYTNSCARYNLRWAARLPELCGDAWNDIAAKLHVAEAEIDTFCKAAQGMYLPYDEKLGIHAQDDAFLKKPLWDMAATPADHYPLLLHYHPLTLYRHQVCKQADTILAYLLFDGGEDRDTMRRTFAYYEKITTHDSSLSQCIFSIVASKLGLYDKAWDYFGESLCIDLRNTHGNTGDGIHTANMGGSYMMVVNGFAGMEVTESGLSFAPFVPKAWRGYRFRICLRESLLEVHATHGKCTVRLIDGNSIAFRIYGREVYLSEENPVMEERL
ncbi:MAG: glycosyl hydrolase family 65 protein [Eubacteriales bacterium]|nr:glycosyl hydrolase family 65 protein [Eubacteriales bacterium]